MNIRLIYGLINLFQDANFWMQGITEEFLGPTNI